METTSKVRLEEVFLQVAQLVRDSTSADETTDNDTKLKLYGLYKHATEGTCSGDSLPSMFQVVARAKYQAWQACGSYTRVEAMMQYVRLLSQRNDELGKQCQALLESVNSTEPADSNETVGTEETTTPDNLTNDDEIKKSNPAPLRKHHPVTQSAARPKKSQPKKLDGTFYGWMAVALGYFGIRPFIPRGLLDISFADLLYALMECLRWRSFSVSQEQKLLADISKLWKDATECEIAVGLSVRSIFDVYLCSKSFVAESEVIVFPPISVPGMMHVADHHNLKIVPVDIGETEWWNGEGIANAITKRTVAIMVVHPFGIVSASAEQLKELRRLADTQKVELWEDCAETFTGLGNSCYLGDPCADIRFFSFGQIKTATALGGGVAVFRDGKMARCIQQLCTAMPQRQTRFEFFQRVILSICLNYLGKSPLRAGIVWSFCSAIGISYETVVTRAIRGFRLPNQTSGRGRKSETDRLAQENFIRQIRKKPSLPLLKLLLRRIRQCTSMAPTVSSRLKRCDEMKLLLQASIPEILISTTPNFNNTYWSFPIQCSDRDAVSRRLQRRGFDVVSGASQLCCVSKFTKDKRQCARTNELMSSILYLPIASQGIPDMAALANCLEDVCQRGKKDSSCRGQTKSARLLSATTVTFVFAFWALTPPFRIYLSIGSLFRIVVTSLGTLAFAALTICLLVDILRRATASLYLDGTTAFAKHCDMIDAATFKEPRKFEVSDEHVENILSDIDALTLPAPPPVDATQHKVILTGATGFVGSMLLRDLLFHRDRLSLGGGVIVVCRRKGAKSAEVRVAELLASPMFSFLSESQKNSLVHVVEGDVSKPLGGLCNEDHNRICNDGSISHVFHAAAAVGFTQALPEAARSNITSSLHMQSLTTQLRNKSAVFVYISTAFVHGGSNGSLDAPLQEELFPLTPFDPAEIYRSMLTTQYYASKAMAELRFPNTYTFSKCVCEHMLLASKSANNLVIRPNIVGPAIETPFEGWAGRKPSTIVAGAALHLSSQWNLWCLKRHPVSCIPVDVLSRFILAKTFRENMHGKPTNNEVVSDSDGSFEKISRSSDVSSDSEEPSTSSAARTNGLESRMIVNATWDPSSTSAKSFCWLEFSAAYLQLGCVMGYFSRASALLGLTMSGRLVPSLGLDLASFGRLHDWLVRLPIELLVKILDNLGLSSSVIRKIIPFLDLPLLFFPFMTKPFYFESELVAPESYDPTRYVFSCGVAAHRFISAFSSKTNDQKNPQIQPEISSLVVGGASHDPGSVDIIWAMSQPRGSYILRFAAFVYIKILRTVCSALTVDLASFRHILDEIKNSEGAKHLVLAPTHRSFFDFVLLSYIFFSLPELQVEIPLIIAANDFERLPVIGWLARKLGAFYVRRGVGFEDSELSSRLRVAKEAPAGKRYVCFEVFLEGKRSRDRRFVEPKTGLLKGLKQSGGDHVVIPIAINYESIPEQKELLLEMVSKQTTKMSTSGCLGWLKAVVRGQVFIGKIHVAAAKPIHMNCASSDDFKAFGKHVQQLQREMVLVSDYHINAAAKFFNIDQSSMKSAMEKLGCEFWPSRAQADLVRTLQIPTDQPSLFSILLQCSTYLAPLFFTERRKWAKWLYHGVKNALEGQDECEATRRVYEVLLDHFDYADSLVSEAVARLNEQGFRHPKHGHVLQVALALNKRTLQQIVRAAVAMEFPELKRNEIQQPSSVATLDLNLEDTKEKLGYWGFNDSGFVVTSDSRGDRSVKMQGTRYNLAGRRMTKLLPFIESEMQVKVNLMKEFETCHSVCHDYRPSSLDNSSQELLSASFKRVSFSTVDRVRHGTGHSQEDVYGIREGCKFRIPDAVVWPASETQIEELVSLAQQRKWCLIPYGGGTNVTCATRCPEKSIEERPIISVDMKLMCRILWLNGEDGVANIEAGITGRQLVEELRLRGYTMGHEPDSIEFSTLGGWIATKASGMKRSKYGNIEDIVKDVSVVSNKPIWKGNKDEKVVHGRVAEGLQPLSLMLGSEGCLGIITSAVVRIWPLPEAMKFDSIVFPSFSDGLSFARAVARLGGNIPASVRLLDNAHFRLGQALRPESSSISSKLKELVGRFLALSSKFDAKSIVCATITYEGSKPEVGVQKRAIQEIARVHDGMHLGSSVGKSGYDLTFMIAYLRDFAMTYHMLGESFETFVPWSKIEALIEATKKRISHEHQSKLLPGIPFVGCRVTQLYHEGACLYFYLCISIDGVENGSKVFSALETAAREEILKHGGSISHHHGIGKLKAPLLVGKSSQGFGDTVAMVKKGIDADNIFGARNGLFSEFPPGEAIDES